MSQIGTNASPLRLLFTCVGRRVELVQAFRSAARRLRVELRILATDQSPLAPALSCADTPLLSRPIADAGYVDELLRIVREHAVQALIPTIDTDLLPISARRDEFEALGCVPLIATADVIRTCRDKLRTYEFLRRARIDTPTTYTPEQVLGLAEHRFPYLLKPRGGSASKWVHRIEDTMDLDYYLAKAPDPIVQEFVAGDEYTLDAYVGLSGRPRCVVPRRRWQVRGGEVSQGVVVKDREIMDAGRRVVEALGDTLRGLVTLQCIVTSQRRIRFIEINPRFGGGAPLGIAAGADYPGWLIGELLGRPVDVPMDGFAHGLCMSRYDWSVFTLSPDATPRLAVPMNAFPPFGSP